MIKYVFIVPLKATIKSFEGKEVEFVRSKRATASSHKIASGTAKGVFRRQLLKKFPISDPKIVVNGEIKVKCRAKNSKNRETKNKKRNPRPRKLPFEREKKYELLGTDSLDRKIIEYKHQVIYLYPNDHISFCDGRLIISTYEHKQLISVKIFAYNKDNVPVMVKWDRENILTRKPEIQYFFFDSPCSRWLSKVEFKMVYKIGRNKFKKYLKEVKTNE